MNSPRRTRSLTPFLVVGFVVVASAAGDVRAAGDSRAGRAKAQMCQACHGIDGLSKVPDAPNIAGQVEGYLVTQLQAFKSGARKSEAMTLVASALSEHDIDNLAAYFSSIEIRIGKLPGE
ncbi:MAG: cytochrome c [Casimicrobiaceae bacterium]